MKNTLAYYKNYQIMDVKSFYNIGPVIKLFVRDLQIFVLS
jgi:hypothetical protein